MLKSGILKIRHAKNPVMLKRDTYLRLDLFMSQLLKQFADKYF